MKSSYVANRRELRLSKKRFKRRQQFIELLWVHNLVTSDTEVNDWINTTFDYHQLCSWLLINTKSIIHEPAIFNMLLEAKQAQEEQFDWTDESSRFLQKISNG
jgi:hypothetical protein